MEESRTKQLKAITDIFGGERIEHPNDRRLGIYFMPLETSPQAGTCGKGVVPEKLQQKEASTLNYPLQVPLCSKATEQYSKVSSLGLGEDASGGKMATTQT